MTAYLNQGKMTFPVGTDKKYRDNWEQTFGKKNKKEMTSCDNCGRNEFIVHTEQGYKFVICSHCRTATDKVTISSPK